MVIVLAAALSTVTAIVYARPSDPPDVVVKSKPDGLELVMFIHYPKYPKAKPAAPGGGGTACPSKISGKWATKNLSFSVNPNGAVTDAAGNPLTATQIVAAVTAGFTPWDAASGLGAPSISTFAALPSSYASETRNGVNEIAWASLSAKGFGNAIAVTYVWRSFATKAIVETDMVNNSDPGFDWVDHAVVGDANTFSPPATGKYDLTNIDTHEFGHVVGLDHVTETQHTMYRYGATDEVKKRSLECGEVKGVQKNYGTP